MLFNLFSKGKESLNKDENKVFIKEFISLGGNQASIPFAVIIKEGLDFRKKEKIISYLLDNRNGNMYYYISRMIENLLVEIQKTNANITFKDVEIADRNASGHSDYHRKFAFYCLQLSQGKEFY